MYTSTNLENGYGDQTPKKIILLCTCVHKVIPENSLNVSTKQSQKTNQMSPQSNRRKPIKCLHKVIAENQSNVSTKSSQKIN